MNRFISAAAFALLVLPASAAYAQTSIRSQHTPFPTGTIEGRVLDDAQAPVVGAMVSVVGRTTAAATTDRDGRYALKDLPYGPYVLSVHSRGYWQSHGRTVQLTAAKVSAPSVQLARAADKIPAASSTPLASVAAAVSVQTQLAGFGDVTAPAAPAPAAAPAPVAATSVDAPAATADSAKNYRRRRGGGHRLAPSPSAAQRVERRRHRRRGVGVPSGVSGARRGLVRPRRHRRPGGAVQRSRAVRPNQPADHRVVRSHQDSCSITTGGRSVAFVSVGTQAAGGAWAMQGAMTQGDLASWIVAGSYKSIASASHAYDLGLSYSMQRYDGGNAAALGGHSATAPATSAASMASTSGRCRRASSWVTARRSPATTTSKVPDCGARGSA